MAKHQAELEVIMAVKKIAGLAAIAAFGKSIYDAGSEAEQAMGAVDAVFKGNADQIDTWSKTSSQKVGLAQRDYQQLASTFGAQLGNMGISSNELAGTTDKLIGLGADLSAQFGGSTSQAVEAIGSLMRGERDPIEKYGVSISAAAVAAKKAELGLSGLTGAADKQATTQATLALLTQQTASAQGAFAREAGTAQGKQARLTAAFEDAKATIGQALLPAAVKLFESLSGAIPTFTTLATVAANVVSAIADLPQPLQLMLAAMIGFAKYGGGVTSFLGKLVGSFRGATGAAGGFAGGMKSVGKALALGGAVAGVGLAISAIVGWFEEAERRAQAVQNHVDTIGTSLAEANGKWTAEVDKQFTASIEQSEGFKAVTAAGLSYADAMDIAKGKLTGAAAAEKINTAGILDNADASRGLMELLKSQKGVVEANGIQKLDYANKEKAAAAAVNASKDALTAYVAAVLPWGAALSGQAKTVADAGKTQQQFAQDVAAVTRANAEQVLSAGAVGAALSEAKDDASDFDRSLQFLTRTLDTLAGRNRTTEQAAVDLNESIGDLKDGFYKASHEGHINERALVDWNVKALTANSSGRQVYGMLNQVRTAYDSSAAAAYQNGLKTGGATKAMGDARKAADSARAMFIQQAGAMGLNQDQAGKLADKLGILEGKKLTKKQFDVIAKDQAAQDTLRNLDKKALADKSVDLFANPDPANTTITDLQRQDYSTTVDVYAQKAGNWNIASWIGTVLAPITNILGGTGRMAGPPAGLAAADGARMASRAAGATGFATPLGRTAGPSLRAMGAGLDLGTAQLGLGLLGGGTVINVNGALDPDGVARQIDKIVAGRKARTSRRVLGTLRTAG